VKGAQPDGRGAGVAVVVDPGAWVVVVDPSADVVVDSEGMVVTVVVASGIVVVVSGWVVVVAGPAVVVVPSGGAVVEVSPGTVVVTGSSSGVGVVVVGAAGGGGATGSGNRVSMVTGGHIRAADASGAVVVKPERAANRPSATTSVAPAGRDISSRLPRASGVGNPTDLRYVGTA
jgi:hypothetical protein